MLQIQFIRSNTNEVKEGLRRRNFKEIELVDTAVDIDNERRSTQQELDSKLSEINKASKEIGSLFAQGKKEQASALREAVGANKGAVKQLEAELKIRENELQELLLRIPNLPHASVPEGSSAEQNEIIREGGDIPVLMEGALPHWELAGKYDIIDLELGNKITGSGFPVFKGKGSKLQRALISFFLDSAIEEGYLEITPPLLVNQETAFGTGQLPDKEGQMYYIQNDDLYLIPTAEVPVTNILRGNLMDEQDLPIKFTGYTPCFRREAGSYGKDVRGLNRVHQFDKVEIVQACHPDLSYQVLDKMVEYIEGLLKKLELPYRIVRLCGGDMGFTAALTYDFEVYSAAQKKWLEVSSVSNFETYQSNRMQIRYRDKKDKKNSLVHTLNGSALALPRIIAAILENNQTEEGIKIPDVLVTFFGEEMLRN